MLKLDENYLQHIMHKGRHFDDGEWMWKGREIVDEKKQSSYGW